MLTAEHICCYAVCDIKIKHNNVDNINTFKSLSRSSIVAQILEAGWSKWEVTGAKLRIMECVEGEEHKVGSELSIVSTGILSSCLPGSSQKIVANT